MKNMSQYNLNPLSAKSCAKFACFIAGFLRLRFVVASLLVAFGLMSAQAVMAQTTMKIINNFNFSPAIPNAANYFSSHYNDHEVWLFFSNTGGCVTYTDSNSVVQTVADHTSIQLITVNNGEFHFSGSCSSTVIRAGLGSSSPFGSNDPGIFDQTIPFAMAEVTTTGNANCDVSYIDQFSFPTTMTVYESNGQQKPNSQCTFTAGTQAEDVINALKAAMPNTPTGPAGNNYPSPNDLTGWGPLVPTVSGNASANSWIGSSKSSDSPGNLSSTYIYAPTFNEYLAWLKQNETTQFNNGIFGWYFDYSGGPSIPPGQNYSGPNGYSGYLSITGSDGNYGLRFHDIRLGNGQSDEAPSPWKADPTAGAPANGEITVAANNSTISISSGTENGLWTDRLLYSGACAPGTDFASGPLIQGSGSFALGQNTWWISSIIATVNASIQTGFLGSQKYKEGIAANTPNTPYAVSTGYWFKTMQRTEALSSLFDKAWPSTQKFYDPFWRTMAFVTSQQGYLSTYNDRWEGFTPHISLAAGDTITWELGLLAIPSGTHAISGTVSGAVQEGVAMTLSDASTGTATTGANGAYSFSNLHNGTYVITPVLTGYTFSPPNHTVLINNADQPGQNFTATAIVPGTFTISGTVTNSSGSVESGVTMSLSGGSIQTATTHTDGTYRFGNLHNGTYIITPVLAGYTFSPPYSTVHINNADPLSQNFTATAIVPNTFTISGTVTNSSGSVESGVTMSLSGGSIQTATTHTDGTYHFGNLPQGTYTVTPTPTDDHTFSPKSKRNIVVGPSATADFKAIPASLGTLVAHGLDFPIYANELNPPQVTFMDNPVVHARYLHDGKSAETKLKVLTKVDKNTGSPSINSLWTKRIRLYNSEDFKEAQKNGSDALDWLANSANQSRLLMSLYLKAKDVEDQMIGQLTLEEPVISNITPGLDANDNEVLIITGNWIGTTHVRVWREFIAEEGIAIKKQTMNVVKPTRANAEGYTDHEGKPAFMNSESGASKLIVRVPKKDPKGTLNGNIVIENGAAMAAYSLISIPPQPSTENNDSIIVRSGKPTVPAVEGGVQNQSGAMYSNTNAYSNGTQSFAVGVEQQWIGYGQPLDNVAVNWMTCFNFSPLEWAMSGNQKQHQPEGIAKLMDIVQLYGWDGINACYTNSVGADTETLFSDDDKVLQLCKSMGKDLRPLLYFWGILPANSANLAAQVAAAGLTPPIEIRDLLYHYKALVPADNAAFRSFCMNYYGHQPSMGGFCFEQDHARQWSTDLLWSPDVQLSEPYQVRFPTEIYDETASAEVKARVQEIINTYWNPADLNLDRVVNGADLALMLSESWGPCGTNCLQDLNLDGVVNGADFNLMMSAWGSTTN